MLLMLVIQALSLAVNSIFTLPPGGNKVYDFNFDYDYFSMNYDIYPTNGNVNVYVMEQNQVIPFQNGKNFDYISQLSSLDTDNASFNIDYYKPDYNKLALVISSEQLNDTNKIYCQANVFEAQNNTFVLFNILLATIFTVVLATILSAVAFLHYRKRLSYKPINNVDV